MNITGVAVLENWTLNKLLVFPELGLGVQTRADRESQHHTRIGLVILLAKQPFGIKI
jgi:hypothetical protein